MFSQFGFSYGAQQQLGLSSAATYIEGQRNIDNLIYFVNEVQVKSSYKEYDAYSHKTALKAFEKASTMYGIKIIPPLRTLLLRMLNEHLGFVQLHQFFLKLCLKFSAPKEALPILEYPGLFKYMTKEKIAQFLINGCDILIQLRKYAEAYELLMRGHSLELLDAQLSIDLYSRSIVLMIYLGKCIPEDTIQKLKNVIAKEELGLTQDNVQITEAYQQIMVQRAKKIDFYINLHGFKHLQAEQQKILMDDGLLEVYEKSQWTHLATYINGSVKKNNWRIKAESISEVKLDDLKAISGINSHTKLYKYDCKNKIMYFNHQQSDQEKLNKLITKAYNMSTEVAHSKVERAQPELIHGGFSRGIERHDFRGSRGLGGLGDFSDMFSRRREHF